MKWWFIFTLYFILVTRKNDHLGGDISMAKVVLCLKPGVCIKFTIKVVHGITKTVLWLWLMAAAYVFCPLVGWATYDSPIHSFLSSDPGSACNESGWHSSFPSSSSFLPVITWKTSSSGFLSISLFPGSSHRYALSNFLDEPQGKLFFEQFFWLALVYKVLYF